MTAEQGDTAHRLGARLRYERNLCGLTQAAVADRCAITGQQVSEVERGAGRTDHAVAIAALFGVDVDRPDL